MRLKRLSVSRDLIILYPVFFAEGLNLGSEVPEVAVVDAGEHVMLNLHV